VEIYMTAFRKPTSIVILTTVSVAGAWTARGFHRAGEVNVASSPVTRGAIVRTIVATGTLQPIAAVQVGTQISGTIDALYADYNSIVHKGQVIATLDPSQLDAQLRQAEAALAEAQAALDQAEAAHAGFQTAALDARIKLTREEQLSLRDLVPQADLDAARNTMSQASADVASGESQTAVAKAGVAQARAQVDQARVNREHAVITSPIDGIVVARNVDVGQTVAATIAAPVLFNIAADFTRMQVEVDVDETDIGGIETGEPVTFEVESYPDQFSGTISQIRLQPVAEQTVTATTTGTPTATATAVASVVGYATIIDAPNPDGSLRPGMTATVTLHGSRIDNSLRIPNAALSFRPPDDVLGALKQAPVVPPPSTDTRVRRVWRFDGAQFTPLDVRAGITDGQWTEVMGDGPLREGELLATSASIERSRE
jgi:HlyD family secretion protein